MSGVKAEAGVRCRKVELIFYLEKTEGVESAGEFSPFSGMGIFPAAYDKPLDVREAIEKVCVMVKAKMDKGEI